MNHLTNLALAPVRIAAAVLTAAVADRLDALTEQIENAKDDLEELDGVLVDVIERVKDLEAMNSGSMLDDPGYLEARGRIRARHAERLERVVA